ncbi:XRE family transcriptional regulator, partial [Faecalibacterium sp. DFI.5.82]|nr:XRE family transcriptional regulator [Faecalibacterium sp. DFI.5.82]
DFQIGHEPLEIYVDGYVSANIQNLNTGLEATRQMLKKKYAADENDLYMSTLKLGQIDEDEYLGRVLYDELVAILKNIKTEHRKDKSTSDGAMVDN